MSAKESRLMDLVSALEEAEPSPVRDPWRQRKVTARPPLRGAGINDTPIAVVLDTVAPPLRARPPGQRLLRWVSCIAVILGLTQLLAAPIPWLQTLEAPWHYDRLWSDPLYKQISGFSLLGLALLALLLSLRRRVKRVTLGEYATWRSVHTLLGLLAIVIFTLHTGLRLGSGLNMWLASSFVALVFLGSFTALSLTVPSAGATSLRGLLRSVHLLCGYLLLLLLTFHVVAFYYF